VVPQPVQDGGHRRSVLRARRGGRVQHRNPVDFSSHLATYPLLTTPPPPRRFCVVVLRLRLRLRLQLRLLLRVTPQGRAGGYGKLATPPDQYPRGSHQGNIGQVGQRHIRVRTYSPIKVNRSGQANSWGAGCNEIWKYELTRQKKIIPRKAF